jgi:hypothetical protein
VTPVQEQGIDLLDDVLAVYKPDCRYLKLARVLHSGNLQPRRPVVMRGDFEIGASCYINDTGHFNAVEFNICYNQLLYVVVAALIQRGHPAFAAWKLDDFWERQLPEFLIADFHSTFRRAIRGHRFGGEIRLTKAVQRGGSAAWTPMLILYSECAFWDVDGPASRGQVKVVIRNPPQAEDGA